MKIQFSDHALERMNSRGITKDQIEESINKPDEKFHNQVGMIIHKIQIDHESQEKCLLRVFYKEDEDRIVIISAYKTSKIKKYWKGEISEDKL